MRNRIILFLTTIVSLAYAGSRPAYIDCTSKSKRTTINLTVQDISMLSYAKLKVDLDSLVLYEPSEHWVIFSKEDSVLTINARYKKSNPNKQTYYFELWALPNTFNYVTNERHLLEGRFAAKVNFSEPRKGKGLLTPTIQVGCKIKYSI